VQSLLAAKTKQEVEAIVAEAFDTAESLGDPLEAILSRSSSRTNEAAGASAGGASSLGGGSTFSSQSTSTEKLSAEIESYKQQIADLQKALDTKAAAATAATDLSRGADETVSKLEQKLAAAEAEKASAQAAQQELQQQRAAAEEAQQQLLLQINVLSQETEQLKQLSAQLAQAQAANAELLLHSNTLQQALDAAQQQLQDMQLEKLVLQQQTDKVAALEAQVVDLQQLLAQKRATHDASTEADMVSPRGRSKGGNALATGSSAAVSAVRAATHSLLLQSNPFEVGAPPSVILPAVALCAGGLHSTNTEPLKAGAGPIHTMKRRYMPCS
jgi:chromosome segregation ATPase